MGEPRDVARLALALTPAAFVPFVIIVLFVGGLALVRGSGLALASGGEGGRNGGGGGFVVLLVVVLLRAGSLLLHGGSLLLHGGSLGLVDGLQGHYLRDKGVWVLDDGAFADRVEEEVVVLREGPGMLVLVFFATAACKLAQ